MEKIQFILLVYLPSFFSQVTFAIFESSAATCYYQSNHSNVEAITLSRALPKDTTGELAGLLY